MARVESVCLWLVCCSDRASKLLKLPLGRFCSYGKSSWLIGRKGGFAVVCKFGSVVFRAFWAQCRPHGVNVADLPEVRVK